MSETEENLPSVEASPVEKPEATIESPSGLRDFASTAKQTVYREERREESAIGSDLKAVRDLGGDVEQAAALANTQKEETKQIAEVAEQTIETELLDSPLAPSLASGEAPKAIRTAAEEIRRREKELDIVRSTRAAADGRGGFLEVGQKVTTSEGQAAQAWRDGQGRWFNNEGQQLPGPLAAQHEEVMRRSLESGEERAKEDLKDAEARQHWLRENTSVQEGGFQVKTEEDKAFVAAEERIQDIHKEQARLYKGWEQLPAAERDARKLQTKALRDEQESIEAKYPGHQLWGGQLVPREGGPPAHRPVSVQSRVEAVRPVQSEPKQNTSREAERSSTMEIPPAPDLTPDAAAVSEKPSRTISTEPTSVQETSPELVGTPVRVPPAATETTVAEQRSAPTSEPQPSTSSRIEQAAPEQLKGSETENQSLAETILRQRVKELQIDLRSEGGREFLAKRLEREIKVIYSERLATIDQIIKAGNDQIMAQHRDAMAEIDRRAKEDRTVSLPELKAAQTIQREVAIQALEAMTVIMERGLEILDQEFQELMGAGRRILEEESTKAEWNPGDHFHLQLAGDATAASEISPQKIEAARQEIAREWEKIGTEKLKDTQPLSPELQRFAPQAEQWHEERLRRLGISKTPAWSRRMGQKEIIDEDQPRTEGLSGFGVMLLKDRSGSKYEPATEEKLQAGPEVLPLKVPAEVRGGLNPEQAAKHLREFMQALTMVHEKYHEQGPRKVILTAGRNASGEAVVENCHRVAWSSALEEGMAVRMEKDAEEMVARAFPEGAAVYRRLRQYTMEAHPLLKSAGPEASKGIRIEDFDGETVTFKESYPDSVRLVDFLFEVLGEQFERSVEQCKMDKNYGPLQELIKQSFGNEGLLILFAATEEDAAVAETQLRALLAKRQNTSQAVAA